MSNLKQKLLEKVIYWGAILFAALFVNTSCKEIFGNMDLNGGSTVSSYLSISTSTLNLDPGESAQRVATSISPATISYESENPAVATVDQQGNVTAVALGETRIKVSVPASGNYDAGTVYYPVAVKYFTPPYSRSY